MEKIAGALFDAVTLIGLVGILLLVVYLGGIAFYGLLPYSLIPVILICIVAGFLYHFNIRLLD